MLVNAAKQIMTQRRPMAVQDATGATTTVKPPVRSGLTGALKLRPVQQVVPSITRPPAGNAGSSWMNRARQALSPQRATPQATPSAPSAPSAPSIPAAPPSSAAPAAPIAPPPMNLTLAQQTPPSVAAPTSASPSTPAGTATPAPAPTPAPTAAPAAAPSSPGYGYSSSPIAGNETPQRIEQRDSDQLQAITGRMQQEAMRQLDAPTVYDDELFGRVKDSARAGIDRNFRDSQGALEAELQERGINFSSIAGGRFNDLQAEKARALTDLDTSIMRDRAMALAEGRRGAFDTARGVAGFQDTRESRSRDEARGERAYTDTLRRQARQDSIDELGMQQGMTRQNEQDFLRYVMEGLGYGSSAGGAYLDRAGDAFGDLSRDYGSDAAQSEEGLGDLARLALEYFGGGR